MSKQLTATMKSQQRRKERIDIYVCVCIDVWTKKEKMFDCWLFWPTTLYLLKVEEKKNDWNDIVQIIMTYFCVNCILCIKHVLFLWRIRRDLFYW